MSRGSEAPRDGREPDRGDATGTRRHAAHPETRRGQGASAGGAATGLRPAPKAKAEGEHTRTPPTLRPTSAGEGEARHGAGGWKRASRVGERRAKARQGRRGTPQRLPRASRRRPPPFPPPSSDRHTPPTKAPQRPPALSRPSRPAGRHRTDPPAPHGWQRHASGTGGGPRPLRSLVNDPSAGSPTETLLRLLLPLDSQVRPSSQRSARAVGRPRRGRSEGLTKPSNR